MKNDMYPCLWFDGKAGEAMNFYCSVFDRSEIVVDTPSVVQARLDGQMFMGLNGGPQFQPNTSVSFMVICDDRKEAQRYWNAFSNGGQVLMPLDSYAWSEQYGWIQDRFGISWQVYLAKERWGDQKIIPTLMFCAQQQGKAEEAIAFYTSVFKNTEVSNISRYPEGSFKGQIQHARLVLNDYELMAMDSGVPQNFTFNEGISMVLTCDTQGEIDHYWNAFTEKGKESMCGWCQDPYGVYWQVIPKILGELMREPGRAKRVMDEVLKMKKLDIDTLVHA